MFGQVESFKVFDLRIVRCLIELRAVCSLFGEL